MEYNFYRWDSVELVFSHTIYIHHASFQLLEYLVSDYVVFNDGCSASLQFDASSDNVCDGGVVIGWRYNSSRRRVMERRELVGKRYRSTL